MTAAVPAVRIDAHRLDFIDYRLANRPQFWSSIGYSVNKEQGAEVDYL